MNLAFSVGDNAVYPVHGVARVVTIEDRDIGGSPQCVYILKILETGLTIMVPCSNASAVGMREIIKRNEVNEVYEILRGKEVASDNQTWNRRYREYMEKIKTGSCFEIAEVLRDLALLRTQKELSFGERRMLDTARTLLVRELALAKKATEDEITEEIENIFLAA